MPAAPSIDSSHLRRTYAYNLQFIRVHNLALGFFSSFSVFSPSARPRLWMCLYSFRAVVPVVTTDYNIVGGGGGDGYGRHGSSKTCEKWIYRHALSACAHSTFFFSMRKPFHFATAWPRFSTGECERDREQTKYENGLDARARVLWEKCKIACFVASQKCFHHVPRSHTDTMDSRTALWARWWMPNGWMDRERERDRDGNRETYCVNTPTQSQSIKPC